MHLNIRPITKYSPTALATVALTVCAALLQSGCAVASNTAASFAEPVVGNFQGYLLQRSHVLHPGATGELTGKDFIAGQTVRLLVDDQSITEKDQYTVDAKGSFSATVTIPENASIGLHPVVVETANPATTTIYELKVSRDLKPFGEEKFNVSKVRMEPEGLYEVAYSPKQDAIYVSSTVGKVPPQSALIRKLDAKTLKVLNIASTGPNTDIKGAIRGSYGIGVDDTDGTIWVTDSRTDSVGVYRESDLSLVHQFPSGSAPHAHDVRVDPQRHRAYATSTNGAQVEVYDTQNMVHLGAIQIPSRKLKAGVAFNPMRLDIDTEGRKLYTVSRYSSEAAVIDLDREAVDRVIAIPGARIASGVAVAPGENKLFVASQDSDSLHIIDLDTDEVLHEVYVGAGALNVVWEPVNKLAWVASRTTGTIAVVNLDGEVVAILDGGKYANHLATDGKGAVFEVNQARDADEGDWVRRIVMK